MFIAFENLQQINIVPTRTAKTKLSFVPANWKYFSMARFASGKLAIFTASNNLKHDAFLKNWQFDV